MSSKVKSLLTLGSVAGFRTRPRPRIRPSPSPSINTDIHKLPNGPGCSRWLTCTCCRQDLPEGTFFSSSPPESAARPSSLYPAAHSFSVVEAEETTIVPPRQAPRTPHLPLPPSLPYSPKSHPFRRHLDILSLSLFASPNESWDVYSALHPSLRQYIPDNTFRSLLAHQLKNDQPRLAWHRAKILFKLAKQCAMAVEDLGLEVLTQATGLGLQNLLLGEKKKADEKDFRLIRRLWAALSGMVDHLAQISYEVRRDWLKVQQRFCKRENIASKSKSLSGMADLFSVETAVVDLVERGGGEHLERTIGRLLFHSRGGTANDLLITLRLMAWCISKGLLMPVTALVPVMLKLVNRWKKRGLDGLVVLSNEISAILAELERSSTSRLAQELERAYGITVHRSQGKTQKILALLEANELGLPGLINRGISLAFMQHKEMDVQAALTTCIRLFEKAARYKDGDCTVLVAAITHALYTAHRAQRPINDLVISFARTVHESHLAHTLPAETIIPLFRLITLALPSYDAYILARKIYQYARASEPAFRWSHHNIDGWQSLFRQSITPSNLHLHFASRLYADLMADGVPIRRTDSLLMIRAIGMNPSPSRPILLERHIKDYLWMNYGRQPAFVAAVVQGLTKTGVNDTDLALRLAQRLLEDQALQPVVVQLVIGQLARSSNPRHRARCLSLLRSLQPSPTATWCYNTVLSFLVTSARRSNLSQRERERGKAGQMNYVECLSYAIALYKEMLSSNIRPNARTISTIIRALVDSDHLASALGVFKASIDQGLRLKSSAVGRLMVRLSVEGRMEEAEQVERLWRSVVEKQKERSWDKGVVGARVLMDIRRGKEVDLDEIARRTGWQGTPSFLGWLDSLKPPSSSPPGAQVAEQQQQRQKQDLIKVQGAAEGYSFWSTGTSTSTGEQVDERRARQSQRQGQDSSREGVDLLSASAAGMGIVF